MTSPSHTGSERTEFALREARKALHCLNICVEGHIVEDVQRKVEAAFAALRGGEQTSGERERTTALVERLVAAWERRVPPEAHGHSYTTISANDLEEAIGAVRATLPCRVYEYDGAFKCFAHDRTWGAVPKPDEPCAAILRTPASVVQPQERLALAESYIRSITDDTLAVIEDLKLIKFSAHVHPIDRERIFELAERSRSKLAGHFAELQIASPTAGVEEREGNVMKEDA